MRSTCRRATLLYRLLFLLYAEARDLLPVRETREYFDASLAGVKTEVAENKVADHYRCWIASSRAASSTRRSWAKASNGGSLMKSSDSCRRLRSLSAVGGPAAAKRELATLKGESGYALAGLLSERQRLEGELAILVEDVYDLNDEERALLRSTRPVRDPLDVLNGVRAANGELEDHSVSS